MPQQSVVLRLMHEKNSVFRTMIILNSLALSCGTYTGPYKISCVLDLIWKLER